MNRGKESQKKKLMRWSNYFLISQNSCFHVYLWIDSAPLCAPFYERRDPLAGWVCRLYWIDLEVLIKWEALLQLWFSRCPSKTKSPWHSLVIFWFLQLANGLRVDQCPHCPIAVVCQPLLLRNPLRFAGSASATCCEERTMVGAIAVPQFHGSPTQFANADWSWLGLHLIGLEVFSTWEAL
jgi:hypothetical protein